MSSPKLPTQVFRASTTRRRVAVLAAGAWVASVGVLAAVRWPPEAVHVVGLALASLGVAEYVLSSLRWQIAVTPDEVLVTPTFGRSRRVPRTRVAGVSDEIARPPTIEIDDDAQVYLPAGAHHHTDELRAVLGSVSGHDDTDVAAPPGPARTLSGLGIAPTSTLRSYTHHPRPWLAIALLSGVSALVGIEAARRWTRGEAFLAIYPAPTADPPSMQMAVIGAALLGPLVHAVLVALLRGVARLLGGDGSYLQLLSGYAVALLPAGLVPLLGWSASIAVYWALFLVMVAVQEAEHVNWPRATSIVLLALAVVPIVTALAALLFGERQ